MKYCEYGINTANSSTFMAMRTGKHGVKDHLMLTCSPLVENRVAVGINNGFASYCGMLRRAQLL